MTTINISGPLFDGLADHEADRLAIAVVDDVSAQAKADWMTFLDSSIRHPTPYYETQITISVDNPHRKVVNDRGIVYGPWLEGVGSRNSPVTRFPGYHSLRRGVTATQARLPQLLERLAKPYVERMNHG
nr:MetaGeneMark_Unknown Function [uncultured bacterium]